MLCRPHGPNPWPPIWQYLQYRPIQQAPGAMWCCFLVAPIRSLLSQAWLGLPVMPSTVALGALHIAHADGCTIVNFPIVSYTDGRYHQQHARSLPSSLPATIVTTLCPRVGTISHLTQADRLTHRHECWQLPTKTRDHFTHPLSLLWTKNKHISCI